MNAIAFRLIAFLLGALLSTPNAADPPAQTAPTKGIPASPLATLRTNHPRLFATATDFAKLKARATAEPRRVGWTETLRRQAARLQTEAPSRYEIPDGLRLLATSRRVLDRVATLGLLYRLEGDERHANRAWQELAAAAAFPDWNPRHFLDTAEMSLAFAIGYDWLYDVWTDDQRATLRHALVEKALQPALECYRGKSSYRWWTASRHNWNQVCNGGIGVGALALADEEPALAEEILQGALKSLPLAMAEFAPDGAWAEGPGYWNYATSFNVFFLAALDTALGTDFDLARTPAFSDTGLFPLYITGPLDRTFNYADGGDAALRAPQMFWLARKFDQPAYTRYAQRLAKPSAFDLLWAADAAALPVPPAATGLPLDRHFRGADVMTFRSAWADRDALFVAVKGGDNQANHSHLDLGTFVLDALGVRWAVDLGAEDYNLPGYFGSQRWTYYRLRAEGHNTLVLNPSAAPDQDPKAAARVSRFESSPDRAFAVVDLSLAYAGHARRVERGIALLGRKSVLIQDEVEAGAPATVGWFLHTPAEIAVAEDGRTATLRQGEQRLWASLLSPAQARFEVRDARPAPGSAQPPKQADNAGIRKLTVEMAEAQTLQLAVWLVPLKPGETSPTTRPNVEALAAWRTPEGAR